MKVTVAKALKIKNRLAAAIKRKSENIQENNSIIKGGKRKVDVKQEIEERRKTVEALIKLKTAVSASNLAIQEEIFRLSELKAELALWETVPCDSGLTMTSNDRKLMSARYMLNGGTDKPQEMTTVLFFEEIEAIKSKLIKNIDQLQDKLDTHNHTVKIEVDDECVNLM
jgi:hypothetical protein